MSIASAPITVLGSLPAVPMTTIPKNAEISPLYSVGYRGQQGTWQQTEPLDSDAAEREYAIRRSGGTACYIVIAAWSVNGITVSNADFSNGVMPATALTGDLSKQGMHHKRRPLALLVQKAGFRKLLAGTASPVGIASWLVCFVGCWASVALLDGGLAALGVTASKGLSWAIYAFAIAKA